MFGRLVAGLIVVGLAIGVWALWPAGETEATTTTTSSPSTTSSAPTTSTTIDSTTTSAEASGPQLVTTVEQAEEILRSFWFGWFEGIYNQDEERIKEVVASQKQLEAAIAVFDSMEFLSEPVGTDISLSETEILRADDQCLAIWSSASFAFRGPGSTSGVEVYRWTEGKWKFVNSWSNRNDLWEQDCDAVLEPLS